MIAHDSPSLFEALPTIRATLALTSRVSRLSKGRGIRSEMLRLSISRLLFLAKADAPPPPGTPPWPRRGYRAPGRIGREQLRIHEPKGPPSRWPILFTGIRPAYSPALAWPGLTALPAAAH